MILTQDEAKNKICPNLIGVKPPGKCKVIECMAWRWVSVKVGEINVEKGFCGIAGKPYH
jgi:hypothetical protein